MTLPRTVRVVLVRILACLCGALPAATGTAAEPPEDFILAAPGSAAPFLIEPGTDRAVARAADDLRADIERVAGTRPALTHGLAFAAAPALVLAGVAGQSPALDHLAAAGKLNLAQLAGAWESFVIAVVRDPFPRVRQALVIAGSDRRGAIYGLYEISAEIGVSPWHWWADLSPEKKSTLTLAAGLRRFGPPSVRYRGIFLNDEDWGLQPWAAKTFEPETGDIGPKTYAQVFELLLRLRANTLWPAMHACTRPFNADPRNAALADAYGIVLGSSHAEPMLRNNVGEWPHDRAADYNYVTHRADVLRYWDERLATNGRYENIYTLGMRGIHDSAMQGPATDTERLRVLDQVIADQRDLLARRVDAEVSRVPQIFCAYKEVLDLYRQGLHLPDDVTLVWPDDNFGYVRGFTSPAERARAGGSGVYYHLSYLGRPLSYLWLCTTPPALIWEEMHKAHALGADQLWIANVGDLKPAEIATEFFLQLAWDIDRWRPDNLDQFLPAWVAREFGPGVAPEIAALLREASLLNFQRKPEHLQWWLPRQPHRPSPLTDAEVEERLAAFADLRRRAEALRTRMPADRRDAFYELVYYPVVGAALANERFFEGERGHLDVARAADAQLRAETRFFNEDLATGKWRHLISLEPASDEWSSMRLARWTPPEHPRPPVPSPNSATYLAVEAADFTANTARSGAAWTVVPGLGRTGRAITVLPATMPTVDPSRASAAAPRLDYTLSFPTAGEFTLLAHLLPTHPLEGNVLRFAIALDDEPPRLVELAAADGGPAWAQGVLDAVRIAPAPLTVSRAGAHTLHVYALDAGVVLDQLVIDLGGLTPTYLGPR